MMMSHGGELLARYGGLLQSHHEYVQSADSSLKGYEEKVAGLELQVSTLKKQATMLEAEKDEEILHLKTTPPEFASFFRGHVGFESGLIARTDYAFLNKISEHAAESLLVILQLVPKKLAHPANAPPLKDARISPLTIKESTVTPASKSLELSANVDLTASVVSSEHNEEMVNAEVDRSDPKMTDNIVAVKSRHAFVYGISVSLEDVVDLEEVGSGRASSIPNDVVIDLFIGEKGNGLVPFSTPGEEAAANSLGLRLSFSFLPFFSDPESCHPP
ncbi:hypothetical protein Tco_0800180 [Tanacetum coccineum]|uniref:Uncharacterized protein n=1 Tax=Tanacetum coccineum TaxID=301880 RepID=A0ABQ4ZTF2_9ASTR